MKHGEIVGKIHNSMYQQLQKSGIAAPVQVLMDLSILSKEDYSAKKNCLSVSRMEQSLSRSYKGHGNQVRGNILHLIFYIP